MKSRGYVNGEPNNVVYETLDELLTKCKYPMYAYEYGDNFYIIIAYPEPYYADYYEVNKKTGKANDILMVDYYVKYAKKAKSVNLKKLKRAV